MTLFRPHQYFRPLTVAEASELLEKYQEKARIIGGGTTIYELAHRDLLSDIEVLIDLRELNLVQIMEKIGEVRIGASATLTDLEMNPVVNGSASLGAIMDSLREIRPLQVKNAATVAGAICAGIPFYDLPVALLSSDARVVVRGKTSEREVLLDDFLIDYFLVDLKPGEFVSEIVVPNISGAAGAFEKFALTGDDWAIINASAHMQLNTLGEVTVARVCLGGGVGPKIRRSPSVEKHLLGKKASSRLFLNASRAVVDDIVPMEDIRATTEYRKHLCIALVEKVLEKAASRIRSGA